MIYLKNHALFFGSLGFGILIWILSYVCLPFYVNEPFHAETIFFVISSYGMLILGFSVLKPRLNSKELMVGHVHKILNILIGIIIISYLFRWIDLFYLRDLSFTNEPKYNRALNEMNSANSNLLLILLSVLKSLYFFPYVISIKTKQHRQRITTILAYLCLFLPLLEAVLKGTRKPLFEIFFIILLTTLVYNRKIITKLRIAITAVIVILLMSISMLVVFQRENLSHAFDTVFYEKLLESRYNEILEPKPSVISFFEDKQTSQVTKFYAMAAMQIGQYIAHGVFEFNHIIKFKALPITYGGYSFSPVTRFFNKIGILNNTKIENPSPREYVYLSSFGAMYIDFRWFTLMFMFLLGCLQKFVTFKSRENVFYAPILIYFSIINVFLPILNYIGGSGIYAILSAAVLLLILKLLGKALNEKSIST